LNGVWEFRLDKEGVGEKEGWYASGAGEGWESVNVPHTYNEMRGGMEAYKGKAWYRRSFTLEGVGSDERVILRFLGVMLRAKVWVNGEYAGGHKFGYIPFELDITEYVETGANELAVQSDNEILERAIPDTKWHGWVCYGGIPRDVYVEIRPKVAITNLWMDTKMAEGGWDVMVGVELTDHRGVSGPPSIDISCTDDNGTTIFGMKMRMDVLEGTEAFKKREYCFRRQKVEGVEAWSPENPKLYKLTAKLMGNGYSRSIRAGFREIKVEGSKIFLNGKQLLIKGTSIHEEYGRCGNVVPRERRRKDIEDIKALGSNFLRSAHYTHHPYFCELCDEIGLLVWTEIPAWQTRTEVIGDEAVFAEWGKPQLEEMIDEYREYPCVVMWSVGNEFPSDTGPVGRYVKWASDVVRAKDETRLVTFASDRHWERVFDKGFKYVDVISLNEYYGWYYGSIYDVGEMLDRIHEQNPDKPILVSEFGSGAAADVKEDAEFYFSGRNYSEAAQVKSVRTHLEQIFSPYRRDFVAGGLIWVYSDFGDPHRYGSGHPEQWRYVNLKGLTTMEREHKPSYEMVRRFFGMVEGKEMKMAPPATF
jgi:beta-glucuronidase